MNKIILFIGICIAISKYASSQTQFVEYKFTGTIGNNQIAMTFLEPDHFYNYLQGYYSYTKYKKDIEFQGEDGVFDGEEKLIESSNGKNTGYFIFYNLDYSKSKIIGKWYTMDGSKSYTVTLMKK